MEGYEDIENDATSNAKGPNNTATHESIHIAHQKWKPQYLILRLVPTAVPFFFLIVNLQRANGDLRPSTLHQRSLRFEEPRSVSPYSTETDLNRQTALSCHKSRM